MGRKEARFRTKSTPTKQKLEVVERASMLEGVPLLLYGEDNNLREVTRCLSNYACLNFGTIGQIVDTMELPKVSKLTIDNDRYKTDLVYRKEMELKMASRESARADIKRSSPKLYHGILSLLSADGEEAVRRHASFKEKAEADKDPLELWRIVKDTHLVPSNNPDEDAVRSRCRAKLAAIKMWEVESLAQFKPRYDSTYNAYVDSGNAVPMALDQAMDFLNALDDVRYGEFRRNLLNDKSAKTGTFPQTVEEMYIRAASYLAETVPSNPSFSAAFGTFGDYRGQSRAGGGGRGGGRGGRGGRGGHGGRGGGGRGAGDRGADKPHEKKRGRNADGSITCDLCGELGHIMRNCPTAQENEEEEHHDHRPEKKKKKTKRNMVAVKLTNVSLRSKVQRRALATGGDMKLPLHLVVLDSAANFSIFRNHKVLGALKRPDNSDGIYGISGDAMCCASIAALPGFFDVGVNVKSIANILSLDEVEQMADVTYVHGVSFTVKTPCLEPIVFKKNKDRLYVSDIRTWKKKSTGVALATVTQTSIEQDNSAFGRTSDSYGDNTDVLLTPFETARRVRLDEGAVNDVATAAPVTLVTVAEKRRHYSRRELDGADKAWSLVKSLSHHTKADVIRLIESGANLSNCEITSADVRRAYEINGLDVSALKGKRKHRAVGSHVVPILATNKTVQTVYSDPMEVDGLSFLVSVAKPLKLLLTTHIPNLSWKPLGLALTGQLAALLERDYPTDKVVTDRWKALIKLKGKLPGVVVDSVGAGDHVVDAENIIGTLKDRIRCVKADLEWPLPKCLVPKLVQYTAGRVNMIPPHGGTSAECPRVQFLGRKVDLVRELGLSFGDYCEVWDPRGASNNTNVFRTHSCIALAPIGNDNMSWEFFDVTSEEFIVKSRWDKLPTPSVIIEKMTAISSRPDGGLLRKSDLSRRGADAPVSDSVPVAESQGQAMPATGVADPDGSTSIQDPVEPSLYNPPPTPDPTLAAGVGVTNTIELSDERPEEEDDNASDANAQPSSRPSRATKTAAKERMARFAAGRRTKSYNFHISVRQGVKTRGRAAVQSMKEELKSLFKKEAMHPVLLKDLSKTQRKKVLRSCMFLKEKFNSQGSFEKLKSRLVANGKQQERSELEDTASPTVKLTSVMIMLAVAANLGMKGSTHDVGTAYLNADMSGEEIHMMLDKVMTELLVQIKPEYKKFVDEKRQICMKLDKALYGCIQSARLWYERLKSSLLDWGYLPHEQDPCVFTKQTDSGLVTLLVHVDDILCLSKDSSEHRKFADQLKNEFKDTKSELSDVLSYLGMTLDFSERNKVKVSMEGYIETLLSDYGVSGAAESPATNRLFEVDSKSPRLDKEEAEKFHTFSCKLLYLAARVRSDISVATSFLCTRVTRSSVQDKCKLDRVIRYLNATKSQCVIFESTNSLQVRAYIDASHATHEDGKGHMGAVVTIGLGPVMTKSIKSKIIAKSSTEDELIALSEFVDKVDGVRDFILSLGLKTGPAMLDMKERPAIVYQDNKSTIALVKQSALGGKDRKQHLKVRRLLVKELVDSGKVCVRYVPTTAMIADILTKPLQGNLFRRLRSAVSNNRLSDGDTSSSYGGVPVNRV